MADLSAGSGLFSRFAHLTGGIAAKAKAEDKDKEKDADEGDEDTKASDEDEMPNGDDDKEDDKKDGKKGKARASIASAIAGYRARCVAIFSSPEAAGNVTLAAELAFNTDLPASAAVALLRSVPAAAVSNRPANLAARMAVVPTITVGADTPHEGASSPQADAAAQASKILAGARAAGAKF
jgi:hypothetical protein